MSPRYLERAVYHRDLPHWQIGIHPLFVTMSTFESWQLPPLARDIVFHHIRRQDCVRLNLAVLAVMPEHVHMVFRPIERHSLAEIMDSIRGPSAHEINKSLARRGVCGTVTFSIG
ncbi:MAG TPA: transposase [Terriglobales bacterium]|nr:transposase [Terriglobales bacterium]